VSGRFGQHDVDGDAEIAKRCDGDELAGGTAPRRGVHDQERRFH
jgi:hypothetical protein